MLFHRFPKAKFVLLERDANKWFDSMVSHSDGKTLGNTHIHSTIYNRENEFNQISKNSEYHYTRSVDNLLLLGENQRAHYINNYISRINDIKMFFDKHDQSRLFTGNLEDKLIWQKMGDFFYIKVNKNYNSHSNISKK